MKEEHVHKWQTAGPWGVILGVCKCELCGKTAEGKDFDITQREGKIAGNRQHPDDEPHSELEFVYLAKCMRALLIKKENPQVEG